MSELKADYAEMRRVATNLSTASTSMSRILSDARAVVTDLTGRGFRTDQASPAFETQFDLLRTRLAEAVAALENFGEFLRSAANGYERADRDLADQLGGGGAAGTLRIDLPELDGLKSNLRATSRAFTDAAGVTDRLSESVLGKANVHGAVSDFAGDWEIRRQKVLAKVDELYEAYGAIVTTMTDVDSELTKALRP